ncbi:MAG TPA: hypothetical protein VH877_09895 [Polyangia bacterium]|jgi:hypothetical protein|nr:hypothetical protein [Polyangia bacterium]
MRQKGIITQAEFDRALEDLSSSVGERGVNTPTTLMIARWSTTFYGFVEADHIFDNTQSFTEFPANNQVARPGTYAGNHPRFTFSVRNSRLGFRLRAPEYHGVRASAQLEMDFLGNQPPGIAEAAFFGNPTFRIRHYLLRLDTPYIDILIGQWWQLYGWQPIYFPNTVQIQGVAGEVYGRAQQIRVSHTFRRPGVDVELAAAASRPPQRDGDAPDGQGGIRVSFPRIQGMQTIGSVGGAPSPLSFAFSGTVRRFALREFSATPVNSIVRHGWAVGGAGFFPILPLRTKRDGALSVHGEFSYGYGVSDLYVALNGGVASAALPGGGAYTANIDPGLVVFSANGVPTTIHWQSLLVGAQYYFPNVDHRLWIAANYSQTYSRNAGRVGAAAPATRRREDWVNFNIFGDIVPGVRFGIEYTYFNDLYSDNVHAVNHHVQFSAFYLF